ncbi:DEAD/DEAH box helicase [Hyphomicrobium sp. D-2]|uniref:DEAD/DEAH box helicase n=1 Tax=Hyphomicrobium sp. D-2 TaxID=3041621 RepID=UPI00245445E2|nr:DEAD/DEAH box helicase [Hyphomicrobium sp. D-2]MDH4982703.1 DEAD/DEAH box helicase [Hyphomicrobium sp. D-2]
MESKTFAELGLSSKVQAAIDAAGYKSPTPIQAAAIPIAVTGRDVLGIAQTGTGKTASFVLPMITRLETGRARARMPRSLILAPTRELAAQVAQSFEKYGVNNKLNLALLIGGVSMEDQVKRLDRGVDVLIATPGRLIDHFQRGRVMLMGVEILVIDEADRMLDMGFIPDIEKICKLLPPRRQTLFFSATMPPEITRLVSQFLTNPERVEVAPPATTAKTITQRFQYCEGGEDWVKREMLRELIRETNVRNAIIFCNRKVDVAILHKSLTKHGFSAGALHGDLDQKSRMETLDKFRSGELKLLAASDVAARGLDIPDVSHVFNFDLPWQTDDYVHRIGRTGRAGKEGHSTSLVTFDELKSMKEIEKMLGEPAEWIGDAPSEEDFAEAGKKRRGRGGRNNAKRGRSGSGSGRSQSAEAGSQARSSDDRSRRSGSGSAKRAEAPVAAGVEGDQPQLAAERSSDKPRRSRRRGGRGNGEARAASSASAPATEAAAAAPVARAAPTSENSAPSRQPRNEDRAPRQSAPRNEQQPERAQQARAPRPQQEQRSDNRDRTPRDRDRQPEKRSLAFADNIPAFLRKPVRRPVKAASE